MARQIGIAQTTLADYEKGRTTPKVAVVKRIAGVLKVQADDIIRSITDARDFEKNGPKVNSLVSFDIQNQPKHVQFSDSSAFDELFGTFFWNCARLYNIQSSSNILAFSKLLRSLWSNAMAFGGAEADVAERLQMSLTAIYSAYANAPAAEDGQREVTVTFAPKPPSDEVS